MAYGTTQSQTSGAEDNDFQVIVLGAGISGLVSASVLVDQGYSRILVIDEFEHVGGNHIDETYGNYTFDIGSLIFQDDSPLIEHFKEILPLYVHINPSWGKLSPQRTVTAYPISLRHDVLGAGVLGCIKILSSVIFARVFHRRIGNAREFARYWIGDHLLKRSGLESYMTRFFGVSAELVDLDFAEKRMLWIKEHASPKAFIGHLFHRPAAHRTNKQLARPRSGFGELYAPAVEKLRTAGVTFRMGVDVHAIRKSNSRFFVTTSEQILQTDRVVSTIPINNIVNLCDLDVDPMLASVTLISLFFSFSGTRGFSQSVLYNFSHDGAWKRLTVYSDFYGRSDEREYFGVEVIADQIGGCIDAAEKDFRRHVADNGLFTGDLTLEGARIVPCAYPTYVKQASERVAIALDALRSFGVESFGRQGAFNYQPTARVSTLEARAALQQERGAMAC